MTIQIRSIASDLQTRAAHLVEARRLAAMTLDLLDRKVIGYKPLALKVRVAA